MLVLFPHSVDHNLGRIDHRVQYKVIASLLLAAREQTLKNIAYSKRDHSVFANMGAVGRVLVS